jgi:peptidyl-prolyl cis-trans isomerase C
MKNRLLAPCALAALLAALAMPAAAQNIAIVNGKALPKERVDALTMQIVRSGRPVTPEMQVQIKEAVIGREVMMQEAQKRGLDATGDFKMQVEWAREELLIRELMADFQKSNPVTDADVKAEYDRFVSANQGKELKARHILVENEQQAKDLIAQIKKGGKFDDLAKKNSKDPGSGANGGDLGWADPGNYVKEFSTALGLLKKGQMTDLPVKSQFGFHIIRLDDERATQLPKFEEVKPQVLQQLQQQKLARFQQELRAKAKVE